MKFDEIRGDIPFGAHIPPTAAGTAIEMPIIELPFGAQVTQILWVPSAAITANDTNYFTLAVRNRQSGSGTVVMAIRAYSSGNGVANSPEVLELSSTESDLLAVEGDLLTAHFTHSGSGLAVPAGLVQVTLRIR